MDLPERSIEVAWADLAQMLFAARGIRSGLWKIGVGISFSAANMGPSDEAMMPTAIVGIRSLVLSPVDRPGPLVFDAGAHSEKKSPGRPAAKKKTPPAAKRKATS